MNSEFVITLYLPAGSPKLVRVDTYSFNGQNLLTYIDRRTQLPGAPSLIS
jgi:hypothetical protein